MPVIFREKGYEFSFMMFDLNNQYMSMYVVVINKQNFG